MDPESVRPMGQNMKLGKESLLILAVTSGIGFNSLARARSPGRWIECVAGIALGSLAKVVAQGKESGLPELL